MYVSITGIGTRLGSKQESASELARAFKSNDKDRTRYLKKNGFERLVVSKFADSEEFYSLSAEAIHEAIARSGINLKDIKFLYSGLACPVESRFLPGFARDISERVGLEGICSVDMGRGCVASMQALQVASDRLERMRCDGEYGAGIILGGENSSLVIDPNDQATSIIFSSGVAAAVVSNYGPMKHIVKKVACRNLSRKDLVDAGHSSNEMPGLIDSMVVKNPLLTGGREFFKMDGDKVYEFAAKHACKISLGLLGLSKVPEGAYIIPHQASPKALDSFIELNGLNAEDVYTEGARTIGNTSSATTLFGLADVQEKMEGREIILMPFGSGPSVGAVYLASLK